MKLPPALTTRTATRLAFFVIILFVLAQVAWWLVFQQRYISEVTQTTLQSWQRDRDAANAALVRTTQDDGLIARLLEDYPHLRFDSDQERFVLNQATVNAFTERQRGFVRMFAFEGPFFVLVVLSGLLVIAKSLRAERELKRRQQNFLSAISHEFKTPLSTLRLLVETAQFRALGPEKQQDYLRRMGAELDRLERTSEQVLAAARLEQNRQPPVLEPLELRTVVQGVVGRSRAGLEARGAKLEVIYPSESLPVSLDPDAFSVVMNNLLDNAVKYTPGMPKPVTVRLVDAGDLALVHVEDRGVGIPEKERERVFERFYRTGSELTRNAPGVGLGLHLVKSISEAMNGWVRLEANAEGGARFTVVLPKRLSAEADETLSIGSLEATR